MLCWHLSILAQEISEYLGKVTRVQQVLMVECVLFICLPSQI